MKRSILSISLAACCAFSLAWGAQENSAPSADMLLKNVRQAAMMQEGSKDVNGQIRCKSVKVPFGISLRDGMMVFQYMINNAWQRFDLKFKTKGQEILIQQGGKSVVLPVAQYAQPIAGTDVTYDDLSLRFLYWPNGKVLADSADSEVKGRDCYIVEVPNPNPKVGQYAWVRTWIDKENGAMWQIDGYDSRGELCKRFIMSSVMKLKDGSWFFKQMKLEVRDPQNSRKTTSVSYVEMTAP